MKAVIFFTYFCGFSILSWGQGVFFEKISAEQAEEWGLIYRAVDDSALMDDAQALAVRLANGPTLALATMKKNINAAMDSALHEVFIAEAEGQRFAGQSEDAKEGGMAFLQKRKAEFKGK